MINITRPCSSCGTRARMMGMAGLTSTSVGGGGRAPSGPPAPCSPVPRGQPIACSARTGARKSGVPRGVPAPTTPPSGLATAKRGRDRAGVAHGHLPRRRVGGRCPNGGHGGTRFSEVPASPLARLRRRVTLGARFSSRATALGRLVQQLRGERSDLLVHHGGWRVIPRTAVRPWSMVIAYSPRPRISRCARHAARAARLASVDSVRPRHRRRVGRKAGRRTKLYLPALVA